MELREKLSTVKKKLRFKLTLMFSERSNNTFTGFLRLPTQFEALTGPVIDFITDHKTDDLRIIDFGCSNGAEPFTIASVMKKERADLTFTIDSFDIDQSMIQKARTAVYTRDEVHCNRMITRRFVLDTFDISRDEYRVKKSLRERVNFDVADILETRVISGLGDADVVFAQNFLVHLKRKDSLKAFANIISLLKTRSALFIDGMDIDIRSRLTREYGLNPLRYKIEEIHNEAGMAKSIGWPYAYWGLEPLNKRRRDWVRRYSTIFIRK